MSVSPSGDFSPMAMRNPIFNAERGIAYPSPFFDVSSTYIPRTVRSLYRWCKFYYDTNPLINSIVSKLSEYPITDIVFESNDDNQKKLWENLLLGRMQYKSFEKGVGIDYHCLERNTKVVTREGVVPIHELSGKTVEVLSKDGVYRKATFRSFGVQELFEVKLGDGESLFATADHEWPVVDTNKHKRKVITAELKGKKLIRTVAPRPLRNEEYWDGVRHGIVFGDGTAAQKKYAHLLIYASGRKQELVKYFEGKYTVSEHHAGKYVGVYGLPAEYKSAPADGSSASYWYGFICGLLATDGHVAKNGDWVTLAQKDRSILDEIAARLPWIGMLGGRVRRVESESGYLPSAEVHVLSLKVGCLTADDFVRQNQREAFLRRSPKSYGKLSKVLSVEPTGRKEEVFCCVEPETHTFVIENGVLTGNCYGNCFVNMVYPFRKYLTCGRCGFKADAMSLRMKWRYAGDRFTLDCPKCGHKGRAKPEDQYILSAEGIQLVRRNPVDIEVKYHEQDGTSEYLFYPHSDLRADIVGGRKRVVATTPNELLEAIRLGRPIRLNPQSLFHLKRTTASGREQGLGSPILLPVLKDTFYLQILKKAQEALSLGLIVPLRIFFPQAGGPMQDPTTSVNLSEWRDTIERELKKFRYDPLYTPILPFPVGHQLIGGEGRALLLSQEIRVWAEHIVIGMGYPPSLVFGDVTWSGSSVALRMLENAFLRFMELRKLLLNFVIRNISLYMGWEKVDYHLKPFKMADDVQKKQIAINLNQAGKISDQTLRSECDYDSEREDEIIAEERKQNAKTVEEQNKINARIQGETMLIQAEYQAKAQVIQQQTQQAMMASAQTQTPGAIGGPQAGAEAPGQQGIYTGALTGLDARVVPRKLAEQINTLQPEQKKMALDQLRMQHPETFYQVQQYLGGQQGQGQQSAQPLPEVLPPRRGPATSTI